MDKVLLLFEYFKSVRCKTNMKREYNFFFFFFDNKKRV